MNNEEAGSDDGEAEKKKKKKREREWSESWARMEAQAQKDRDERAKNNRFIKGEAGPGGKPKRAPRTIRGTEFKPGDYAFSWNGPDEVLVWIYYLGLVDEPGSGTKQVRVARQIPEEWADKSHYFFSTVRPTGPPPGCLDMRRILEPREEAKWLLNAQAQREGKGEEAWYRTNCFVRRVGELLVLMSQHGEGACHRDNDAWVQVDEALEILNEDSEVSH